MTTVERISSALAKERGFVPLEDTDLEPGGLMGREWYAFVGVRAHWGSVMSCGLLPLQNEDEETVAQRAKEFYSFSSSLRQFAGRVWSQKLGGFGLLAVLVDGPSSERFRSWVAAQKRGSAWRHDYCVVWLLDRSLRQLFPHRGFPLRFFPGVGLFRNVLRSD